MTLGADTKATLLAGGVMFLLALVLMAGFVERQIL